jgi:tetratricopeptide (TPR) repeat protein
MTKFVKNALLIMIVLCAQLIQAQKAGMTEMQNGDWDKAITVFSDLIKANPTDQQSMLSLGNAYLAKGDNSKAIEVFEKVYAAKPDGAYALIGNARVLQLKNDIPRADEQFKKAAKAGKKDIDAQRAIGESFLYGKDRNLTRAEEWLKLAYTFKPKDFATLMALGYCYKEMPNGGLAAQHYEFAQAIDPSSPLALYMQARVYRQAKLPEKYVDFMGRALKVDPKYTLALHSLAEYWYFTKRNYGKATEAYQNLINDGVNVQIEDEMQLANCLFLTKKYKECTELTEKIIKKDPTRAYLRRLLGYCYYENNEFEKSNSVLNDYFKIVTPDKQLASDFEYLGKVQVKTKGDTAVAIGNLRKAIQMDTFSWPLYKEIAILQNAQKKNCDAAISYQMFLDSVPKPEPMDYYRMGSCHYNCKEDPQRYEKALKAYTKVTELVPTAGIGWFWAAKAASKMEPDIETDPTLISTYGKAKPYFEKYVEIGGVDPVKNKKDLVSAYEYLSYYGYKRGDVTVFQNAITKLLEIDPTNPTAIGLQNAVGAGGMPAPVGN